MKSGKKYFSVDTERFLTTSANVKAVLKRLVVKRKEGEKLSYFFIKKVALDQPLRTTEVRRRIPLLDPEQSTKFKLQKIQKDIEKKRYKRHTSYHPDHHKGMIVCRLLLSFAEEEITTRALLRFKD